MKKLILALLSLQVLGATGCHAKFKKAAPTLGSVKVQVITTGGPYVALGKVADSDMGVVDDIVNVVQDVRSIQQTDRIAGAVRVEDVQAALGQGFAETLGGGPPFAFSDADSAPATMQLEVLSYGMSVPYLGAPGAFDYTVRARIYRADGERVYSNRMSCTAGVGDPDATAQVLGVVDNVKQLNQMTDEQINAVFVDIARYCGGRFVVKMRKHAG